MTRDELIFCLLCAGCIAITYMTTDIYLPALPILKTAFNTSTATIQSTVSIYMLGAFIAQLLIGPVADHFGFKQTAIPLAILLILSSLVCMLAPSILVLSIGRLLQAISAGGLAVIARPSFGRYFPEKRAMSLYITIVPTVACLSPALAPIIGGFLTHYVHWRSIFLFVAILSALVLFGFATKYHIGKRTDVETSINPLFVLKIYGIFLTNRRLVIYLFILLTTFMTYFAYMAESPFIFHALGYGTREIGFTYFGMAAMFFLMSQLSRKLLNHVAFKNLLHIGFFVMIIGLLLLWALPNIFHPTMWTILVPAIIYAGMIGFVDPMVMGKCIALCPKRSGYASSLVGAIGMLGASIGTQLVNIVTHGSVELLAIYSLAIMLLTWLAACFSPRC